MSDVDRLPHRRWNGMNWIRPATRLAIYLRDGLACVYCGEGLESENVYRLELDHVVPFVKGGTNEPTNLVTACGRCNAARGARSVPAFAQSVSQYTQREDAERITRRVHNTRRRALPRRLANAMLKRRTLGQIIEANRTSSDDNLLLSS